MSFFNPYLKGPDWSKGISDLINQIFMRQLINDVFQPQSSNIYNVPTHIPLAQSRPGVGSAWQVPLPYGTYPDLSQMTPTIQGVGQDTSNINWLMAILNILRSVGVIF